MDRNKAALVLSVCFAQSCLTLQTRGLQQARLLCLWGYPGKKSGVGCHVLLQGIFLTQGLNPGLLHGSQILYRLSQECPEFSFVFIY